MSHSDEPASLLGPHDVITNSRLRCLIRVDEHGNGFHASITISDGASRAIGLTIPATFNTAKAAFDEATAQARSRLEQFEAR